MEKGFDIEGIDYSPEMLASCRKRCQERGLTPVLYEGNVCQFTLDQQYEAIVMPTGTFCLIENHQEALSSLISMYQHLVPGGRLLVDLLLPTDWKTGKLRHLTIKFHKMKELLLKENRLP